VDLEERTIESLPARCQSCGTELTDAERERIVQEGGPALCATCAAEADRVVDEEEDGETAA
jgi:hypothetical protein